MKSLITVGVLALLVALAANPASPQQRVAASFKVPASDSKYTKNFTIDIEDVPNHQIRIYEAYVDYSKNSVAFADVKVKEAWIRDFSDYIETNGHANGYVVYIMDNGDRFFTRRELVRQTIAEPDGTKRSVAIGVEAITGGTGKFKGMRGMLRVTVRWGTPNALEYAGEYWMQE